MLSCFSCVHLFATLWTVACWAPLSMGFSREEYWSGLPCLLQGVFPTQGSNLSLLHLLHCRQILYLLSHQGSPNLSLGALHPVSVFWRPNLMHACLLVGSLCQCLLKKEGTLKHGWKGKFYIMYILPQLKQEIQIFKKVCCGNFPGGPVAKTLLSQCTRPGFDSWSGN